MVGGDAPTFSKHAAMTGDTTSAGNEGTRDCSAQPSNMSGRHLLRNLQCRRDLRLLPGCAALARRQTSASLAPGSPGAQAPMSPEELSELESRRDALASQLAEVESALKTARASACTASEELQATQHDMGAAVDEHGVLSTAVRTAQARVAELTQEATRLEAALQASMGRMASQRESSRGTPDPLTAVASKTDDGLLLADAASPQKLSLHQSHLASLDAENQALRRRCASMGIAVN